METGIIILLLLIIIGLYWYISKNKENDNGALAADVAAEDSALSGATVFPGNSPDTLNSTGGLNSDPIILPPPPAQDNTFFNNLNQAFKNDIVKECQNQDHPYLDAVINNLPNSCTKIFASFPPSLTNVRNVMSSNMCNSDDTVKKDFSPFFKAEINKNICSQYT